MPIIVLSGRADSTDKVEALDAGADDYVTKPFGMAELLARMRAASRRATSHEELPQVRLGDLTVDLAAKRVSRDGTGDIHLTPTEWHLLEALLRNPGKLLTRRQLLTEVWGPGYADAALCPGCHYESMRAWLITRFAGLSPRRRVFFAGVSVAVTAAVLLAGLQAGGVFSTPVARTVPSAPDTVLLVPGYGGGKSALDVLAARIRGTGMSARVVTLPGQGTGDLAAQAGVLSNDVNRALRAGAGQVDVIGYSAGGVVTRLWDATDGGAHKARRVITLGSPLNGTRIAAAGSAADPSACPVACQELVPGSALLTRLRHTPLGRKPGWLSLWSVDDQVVRPPDSARLAGAVNVPLQGVCPGIVIEHGQLPTSPLVIGIVLRALGPGPLTAPGRADCSALQRLGSGESPVGAAGGGW